MSSGARKSASGMSSGARKSDSGSAKDARKSDSGPSSGARKSDLASACGAGDPGADWSAAEVFVFNLEQPTFGRNYCVIAMAIGSKTCAQVGNI